MTARKTARRKPSLSSDAIAEIRDTGSMGRYLGSQLRLTQIASVDALEAAFAPYKSSPTRFALMDQVNERPGCTQATLADLLDVDRTTLVPMIADKERSGLLRRSTLTQDRRAVQLWLTPRGQRLFAKLRPLAVAHEKRLCAGMSGSEKAALIAALRTIRRGISRR